MDCEYILPDYSTDCSSLDCLSYQNQNGDNGNLSSTQSEHMKRGVDGSIEVEVQMSELFMGRMEEESPQIVSTPTANTTNLNNIELTTNETPTNQLPISIILPGSSHFSIVPKALKKSIPRDPLAISVVKKKKSRVCFVKQKDQKKRKTKIEFDETQGKEIFQNYVTTSQIQHSSASNSASASTICVGSTNTVDHQEDPYSSVEIKEEVGELFMGESMDEKIPQTILPTGHVLIQTPDQLTYSTTTRINVPILMTETGELFYILTPPSSNSLKSTEYKNKPVLQRAPRTILPKLDSNSDPLMSSREGPSGRYKCEEKDCLKSYKSMDGLKSHMSKHTGVKRYKCNVCGIGYAHRNSLRQHNLSVHKKNKIECKRSDAEFEQALGSV